MALPLAQSTAKPVEFGLAYSIMQGRLFLVFTILFLEPQSCLGTKPPRLPLRRFLRARLSLRRGTHKAAPFLLKPFVSSALSNQPNLPRVRGPLLLRRLSSSALG